MNLARVKRSNGGLDLCSFACSDVVTGKRIDVEGPRYRSAADQVGDQFVDPRILFMGVSLSILLTFPKAQRQNLVGIGIRYEI